MTSMEKRLDRGARQAGSWGRGLSALTFSKKPRNGVWGP